MSPVGKNNKSNRDEWLKETLNKIPQGSRILDAGAGELQYKPLCGHLNYLSQDFAQYDGIGDDKGFQTGSWDQSKLDIISDITNVPEDDGSFDAIMCVEVFEHLPEPLKALGEFSRLLKSGGHLIITAPFCSLTHFAPYHYYSGFSKYFYEEHLARFNFEIIDFSVNGNYFEYIAQEIRRLPSMSKDYSGERPSSLEHFAMKVLLNMLGRFSKNDSGSDSILNFGYQIYARKKN